MLYYARTAKDGAAYLAEQYAIRYLPPEKYIKEKALEYLLEDVNREILFGAVQQHPDVHAFALPNLTLYFHPDVLLSVIASAYEDYFRTFLSEMAGS